MLQARKTVWPFGLSRFRSVASLSLLLRHLDSSLDSISPARAIRDTSTAQNLRPVHFFLAVLAAARKSDAFGAPLLPGLRGLPPRLRLALMLAYRPGLPFGIVHTQGQCHFDAYNKAPAQGRGYEGWLSQFEVVLGAGAACCPDNTDVQVASLLRCNQYT